MKVSPLPIQTNIYIKNIIIAIVVALVALMIATQSINQIILILGIITFIILALLTPLSVIVIMLIVAPLRTLVATESSIQLPLDIGQIMVFVVVGVWIIHKITNREKLLQFEWTPVYIPIGIIILAIGISAFSATLLSAWLSEWLKWVLILFLVILILDFKSSTTWQWLLFGVVTAGVTNAIIGIYIFLGGSGADHLAIPLMGRTFFRAFGTFGQPNPFGGFMGLLIPISLMATLGYSWRTFQQWRMTRRFSVGQIILISFYGIASGIMTIGLFVSWSRGAWLGFVVSCAVLGFALPRKLWQSIAFFGIILGLFGIFWLNNWLPSAVVDRINNSTEEFFAFDDMRGVDITSENYAVVERLAHWQATLNMTQHNPYIGVGMGNYEIVYDQYRLMNWHEPLGHAHNYYLNILAEAGIIGFLSYFILWGGITWLTWRIRQHPDILARCIGIGLLGTWAYLSVHSLLDNLYVNNVFLHLGILFGILAILDQQIYKTVKVH